ncbi:hypothetical protein BV25DRAFT_1825629 [Artomyces pyxidatus]|uniref:Uncharacterized protein n=1 Tax=Artomyces pyxidatus TaxID=48021 RepID=A0ACB8T0B1_9AGAM|nr:hypothetical protein BV25DRAFT_1825629 [Artomyces pyxidatus]
MIAAFQCACGFGDAASRINVDSDREAQAAEQWRMLAGLEAHFPCREVPQPSRSPCTIGPSYGGERPNGHIKTFYHDFRGCGRGLRVRARHVSSRRCERRAACSGRQSRCAVGMYIVLQPMDQNEKAHWRRDCAGDSDMCLRHNHAGTRGLGCRPDGDDSANACNNDKGDHGISFEGLELAAY